MIEQRQKSAVSWHAMNWSRCRRHWTNYSRESRLRYWEFFYSLLPPYCRGHEAMLRSVRPSVCLFVPFSDSVPFLAVVASYAFDRGQHGRLCLHPDAISGAHIALPRDSLT